MNIKNIYGHVISVVFQPLLLPLLGTIFIIKSNPFTFPDPYENYMLMLRVALLTFFFPALVVLLMSALKFVKGVNLRDRQDRIIPYIATLALYIWAFYVFYKEGFNGIITFMLLGSTISIVLAFLMNLLVLKISMHTTGVGGMVAFFLLLLPYTDFNSLYPFIIMILIAGLVGSARLALHAHTPREIYSGYLMGFFSFMFTNLIFGL
ncbi:MAG TPA: phosphatase PAP2 family protein [Chitinophagales bacterium]|nr:phosphatase PAP2 family protein [Chitinophagales bacterium]